MLIIFRPLRFDLQHWRPRCLARHPRIISLEQQGETTVLLCPWDRNRPHFAVRKSQPGDSTLEQSLESTGVQMPPLPFHMVMARQPLLTFRTGPKCSFSVAQCHFHPFLIQLKFNALNFPRLFQSQNLLVKTRVFHLPDLPEDKLLSTSFSHHFPRRTRYFAMTSSRVPSFPMVNGFAHLLAGSPLAELNRPIYTSKGSLLRFTTWQT